MKWCRTLQELLQASDKRILSVLRKDKSIPDWTGAACPRCEEGVLGPLVVRPSRAAHAHRCSKKKCQQYVSPIHLHPIFTPKNGSEGHPLQLQAAALLLRLGNVSLSTIHILTQINHKAIEKMSRNLDLVRKWHVQREEKKIVFGGAARAWRDVEVDEATFDKKTLQPFELSDADAKANKNVRWCTRRSESRKATRMSG